MSRGGSSGSTRRTSVRSNMSAKVRRRESHSGHSHPTITDAVSRRCARSLSSSPHAPMAAPSRRTTAIPQSARPRLQPRTVGSNSRLTNISQDGQPDDGNTHPPPGTARRHRQRDQCHRRNHGDCPASTSTANAPARICHGAKPFRGDSWMPAVVGVSSTTTVTSSPGRAWKSCTGHQRVPFSPAGGSRFRFASDRSTP